MASTARPSPSPSALAALAAGRWPPGRWPPGAQLVVNVVNVVIRFSVDSHVMRPCSQCSQCSHSVLDRYPRHAAMHRAQFVGHVVNVVNDFGLQNPRWKRAPRLTYTVYIHSI